MSLAEQRRAIGANIVAERRGADIVTDLNSMIGGTRSSTPLPSVPAQGAKPAQRGRAVWDPTKAATGAGIASPLAEASAATREYWPGGLPSSDGLFVLPALKVLNLVDANGAAVQIQLVDPGA